MNGSGYKSSALDGLTAGRRSVAGDGSWSVARAVPGNSSFGLGNISRSVASDSPGDPQKRKSWSRRTQLLICFSDSAG